MTTDQMNIVLGDTILVKNFQAGNKWLPGVISRRTGPVSFVVQISDGCERCCHQDQLQRSTVDVTVDEPIETDTTPPSADTPDLQPSDTEPSSGVSSRPELEQVTAAPEQSVPNQSFRKTYLGQNRTAVQRYQPTW